MWKLTSFKKHQRIVYQFVNSLASFRILLLQQQGMKIESGEKKGATKKYEYN